MKTAVSRGDQVRLIIALRSAVLRHQLAAAISKVRPWTR